MRAVRNHILILVTLVSVIVLYFMQPVSQDTFYHQFADQRTWLGIPHFLDVMSNLPFLIVGFFGLKLCLTNNAMENRSSWLVLFTGVLLVCFGSAYYHWDATNTRLVWDRLPMTIAFMSLFAALLSDYVDKRLGKLLIPLLILGVFSVYYWAQVDDLRIYIWVQGYPMVCILLLLALYESKYPDKKELAGCFVFYMLAKVTEGLDTQIFNGLGGMVSGHTIKHLLAAIAVYFLYRMAKLRTLNTL